MNLFEISIPQVTRTVGQVRVWLDKAQAHAEHRKFDPQVLWTARLAPDQWHFARQVQAVAHAPLWLAAALRGLEPPTAADVEVSHAALRERLDGTLEQLRALQEDEFRGAEERMIALPFAPGKGMRAPSFVVELVLPNFYFHATTAYAILRHNGVDVGKLDFLGPIEVRDL
jgi:uncharacterized protein